MKRITFSIVVSVFLVLLNTVAIGQNRVATEGYVNRATNSVTQNVITLLNDYSTTNQVKRWYANPSNWVEYTGSNIIYGYTIVSNMTWFFEDGGDPLPLTYPLSPLDVDGWSCSYYMGDPSVVYIYWNDGTELLYPNILPAPSNITTLEFGGSSYSTNIFCYKVESTNCILYYLSSAPPLTSETWSYTDMTNWMAIGNAGESWVTNIVAPLQNKIDYHLYVAADPHSNKYVKISGETNIINLTNSPHVYVPTKSLISGKDAVNNDMLVSALNNVDHLNDLYSESTLGISNSIGYINKKIPVNNWILEIRTNIYELVKDTTYYGIDMGLNFYTNNADYNMTNLPNNYRVYAEIGISSPNITNIVFYIWNMSTSITYAESDPIPIINGTNTIIRLYDIQTPEKRTWYIGDLYYSYFDITNNNIITTANKDFDIDSISFNNGTVTNYFWGNEIIVDASGKGHFNTIQAAVDYVDSLHDINPGTEISVRVLAGSYYENVVVRKARIILRGDDRRSKLLGSITFLEAPTYISGFYLRSTDGITTPVQYNNISSSTLSLMNNCYILNAISVDNVASCLSISSPNAWVNISASELYVQNVNSGSSAKAIPIILNGTACGAEIFGSRIKTSSYSDNTRHNESLCSLNGSASLQFENSVWLTVHDSIPSAVVNDSSQIQWIDSSIVNAVSPVTHLTVTGTSLNPIIYYEKDIGALRVNESSTLIGDVIASNSVNIFGQIKLKGTNRTEQIENAITNELDLIALRTYHYGSSDIIESPSTWFRTDDNGTITNFIYDIGRTNIVIPWQINGKTVTKIGRNSFSLKPIVTLIAPKTVTYIGEIAFQLCTNLTYISCPNVGIVTNQAISNCGSLTNVYLPNAYYFDNSALAQCTNLSYINLPNAITFNSYVLNKCYNLKTVILPKIETIGNGAFQSCNNLTSIIFSSNAPITDEHMYGSYFPGINWPATNVICYVNNSLAIGWESTLRGRPVVRLPIYTDALTVMGPLIVRGTDHSTQDVFFPQTNGVQVLGDADQDLFYGLGGTIGKPAWWMQTYRNENSSETNSPEFLYFSNARIKKDIMIVSEGGRMSINKTSNIMDYHSDYQGYQRGGLNDLMFGGVYTYSKQRKYNVYIAELGTPDRWSWKKSFDDGKTWVESAVTNNCSVSQTTLENGVYVWFGNTTGHNLYDAWIRTGYAQLPPATMHLAPQYYEEILVVTNYNNNSGMEDLTYTLASTVHSSDRYVLTNTSSAIYLGRGIKMNSTFFNLSEFGVGLNLVFEYWNGLTWNQITAGSHNFSDGTLNFTVSGQVSWDKSLLTGWATNTLVGYDESKYWIRIRTASNPTTYARLRNITPQGKVRFGIMARQFDDDYSFYVDGFGSSYQVKAYQTDTNETFEANQLITAGAVNKLLDAFRNFNLYFSTNANPNIVPNMILTTEQVPSWTTTTVLNSGTNFIASFVSTNIIGSTNITARTKYTAVYYASKSTSSGAETFWELVEIGNGKTNILANGSISTPLVQTTPTLISTSVSPTTNVTVSSTSYIGIRIYGIRTGASGVSMNLYGGGSYASELTLPSLGGATASMVTDAPVDGIAYGRKNSNWVQVLEPTGSGAGLTGVVKTDDIKYRGIYNIYEGYDSLIYPIETEIALVESNTAYIINIDTNCIISFNAEGLNFTDKEVEFKLYLNIVETNIPPITFKTGIQFTRTPEYTVTGRYENVVTTLDGTNFLVRQTFPTIYEKSGWPFIRSDYGLSAWLYEADNFYTYLQAPASAAKSAAVTLIQQQEGLMKISLSYLWYCDNATTLTNITGTTFLTYIDGNEALWKNVQTNLVSLPTANYVNARVIKVVDAGEMYGNNRLAYFFVMTLLNPTDASANFLNRLERINTYCQKLNELEIKAYNAGKRDW